MTSIEIIDTNVLTPTFSDNYNATTEGTKLAPDFHLCVLCVLCALCGLSLTTCWKLPAIGKIAQLYFS